MNSTPLVSVICLCYNQKPFVEEAIRSVLTQTYENIELIIIDDASNDGSIEKIHHLTQNLSNVRTFFLAENMGNCKAFNVGLKESTGDFIIDLAADDILLPVRVEEGIKDFASVGSDYGIHFSDAFIINKQGKIQQTHFSRNHEGQLVEIVPSGDLYEVLIRKYLICPPTMMIKKRVFDELNGYDESLSYEDFDFWIRSSRNYKYLFNKAPLVKKRIIKDSLSSLQSSFFNRHQRSTLKVCEKILALNKTPQEHRALIKRCNYEIRQCLRTGNIGLIPKYEAIKRKARKAK